MECRYIKNRFDQKKRQFSYCIESYGSPVRLDDIDDAVNRAFALWTATSIPLEFYRRNPEPKYCDSDILIRFVDVGDPNYNDGFGNLSADAAAAAKDFSAFGTSRVLIYVKSHINVAGFDWNKDSFFVAMAHEIGHALGLGHSTAPGSIMASDVTISDGRLAQDDIKKIQALYPPDRGVLFRTVVNIDHGDRGDRIVVLDPNNVIDNYQLAFMPNFIHEYDDFSDPVWNNTQDLFMIKTANTGTGKVEIHSLTGPSKYTEYHVHAGTPLPLSGAHNRRYLMAYNRDLFCVGFANTGSGKVEVVSFTAGSNYQKDHVVAVTPITLQESARCLLQFQLAENNDLFYIRPMNTGSGRVEVVSLTAASNYQHVHVVAVTPINCVNDLRKARFLLAPNRDLFFIKLADTGTNTVEVHSVTAISNYQKFLVQSGTSLPLLALEEENRTFGLVTNFKLISVRKFLAPGASASKQLSITVAKYH